MQSFFRSLLLFGLIAGGICVVLWAEQRKRICAGLTVVVQEDPGLVHPNAIKERFIEQGATRGKQISTISLRRLHQITMEDPYIEKSIVHMTWKGMLLVYIWPIRPIARWLREGSDLYIDRTGRCIKVLPLHTVRVPLIKTQLPAETICCKTHGYSILDLLKYVEQDQFLRAQIAYIEVDALQQVTLRTQVGKERIELGTLENIPEKFNKLRLFYRYIAPKKGWGKYKRVNLAFDKQIVCE